MSNNAGLSYNVDIVMCMDATGSMRPLLDMVKANALSFYSDIKGKMTEMEKHIDTLRVKLIVFRDYLADGENAMLLSDFFTLPEQSAEFERMVKSIEPKGGGDDPEDGLEALGYAMKSKWTTSGDKRRHVIVVWTDDGTHDIGFGRDPENGNYLNDKHRARNNAARYPSKMAGSFDELSQWWGCGQGGGVMDERARRLLIYAPMKDYWTTIAELWDNAIMFPSQAGKGLVETTYDEILTQVAKTI